MVSSEEPQTRQKSEPAFIGSIPRQHRVLVVKRRIVTKSIDDRNERSEKREEHEASDHANTIISAHTAATKSAHRTAMVVRETSEMSRQRIP